MFPWKMIQRNLGLTDEELRGLIKHTYDPIAAEQSNGEITKKYDYKIPGQMRNGMMLKLTTALAIAEETKGEVLRNSFKRDSDFNYNQADYYVRAKR